MKYEQLEQHMKALQVVVDAAEGTISVKETYDKCVLDYLSETQPALYCLKGQEYKQAKLKMREHCFNETTGLVNILLNNAAEAKQRDQFLMDKNIVPQEDP